MTAPEVELRRSWRHLAGAHHAAALDHLLACHREPHRRYHNTTHVMWVLRHIDAIAAAEVDTTDIDLGAVQFAALFHDVVYDPARHDNETISADWAQRRATELGWPTHRIDTVRRLVLATAGDQPTAADEAILIDADLAILGSTVGEYAAYATAVRAEYRHVTDSQWRRGRASVLQQFLDAPAVFHTRTMHRQREARARANLSAELSSLREP